MGIKNLLPTLKPIERHRHVRDFAGKTAGIDALCWMHQGAHKYAKELAKSSIGFSQYASMEKLNNYCM
jgi:exonuclease 1